eukprot:233745-Alexandrium_andersonii.AAC.1
MGWQRTSRNPASALMTRCNADDLSFRDKNNRFDEQRVNRERHGFLDALLERLHQDFPGPADAHRPFIEMLEDD